jgi:hypothetical protein
MTNEKQKDPLPAPQQGLSFDEALTHYIGEFGKGQLRIVSVPQPTAVSCLQANLHHHCTCG